MRRVGNTLGASKWNYVAKWAGSLELTLFQLQSEAFAANEKLAGILRDWELPVPEKFEELWLSEKYSEFMGTHGTHTIMDVPSIGEDGILGLDQDVIEKTFGKPLPTLNDWETAFGQHAWYLWEDVGARWTGRCVILYDESGSPEYVAFWGHSGD